MENDCPGSPSTKLAFSPNSGAPWGLHGGQRVNTPKGGSNTHLQMLPTTNGALYIVCVGACEPHCVQAMHHLQGQSLPTTEVLFPELRGKELTQKHQQW